MNATPDEIADRLYGVPPDTFTEARAAAADQARAAGDRAAAAAITALRKPSVAAWQVNLLALRSPARLAQLAELAAGLRAAGRDLDGARLRELAARRRSVLGGLVDEARRLAVAQRPDMSAARLRPAEVEATLAAALADEQVMEQVRGGRLVHAVAYTGFGDLTAGVDDTEGDEAVAAARHEGAGGGRTPAGAVAAEQAARADVDRAADAQQETADALAELDEQMHVLRERRGALVEQLSARQQEHRKARKALADATRRLSKLRATDDHD